MPRIFISFFNAVHNPADPQVMPCFYESFIKELAKLGNELLVMHHHFFSHDFGQLPNDIKQRITEFSPDFAIIFNNAFYDLSKDFDFPIYIYEVDSLLYYSNKNILKDKKERFHYIVPQISSIENIHSYFGVDKNNILYVPFFTSIRRESIPKTMDISFIGTRFMTHGYHKKTVWNRFMSERPSEESVELFKKLLQIIQRNPYISQTELINLCCSKEFINKIYTSNRIELLNALSGSKRLLTLSEVADLGLVIFGPKNWYFDNCADPNIPLSYNSKKIYSLQHNQDVYNASRLAININHIQATTGFSWRVCDIMASDACLVSEYRPDFERCFPEIPIPFFTNRYEARSLCQKLLNDESLRRDIVAQCNEIIDKKFRFEKLVPSLENFFKRSLQTEQPAEPPRIEAIPDICIMPSRQTLSKVADLKKRCKLVFYLTILISAQLPGFNLCFSPERRSYFLKKINKYWR